MMDRYPAEWELVTLFECDPRVEEDYLCTYRMTRDDVSVQFQIAPLFDAVTISLWRGSHQYVQLGFNPVHSVSVWIWPLYGLITNRFRSLDKLAAIYGRSDVHTPRESLAVHFPYESHWQPLRLEIRPEIKLEWVMGDIPNAD